MFISDRRGPGGAAFNEPEQIREAMAMKSGFDPKLWSVITQDLGWTAVSIPESYGGFGLSFVELTVLMEEMGYARMFGPFFSSVCLAVFVCCLSGRLSSSSVCLSLSLIYLSPMFHRY